jgi:hypothetical protein
VAGAGTHRSPMASCINLAATVLSTPPLTAPITRPFGPQMSLILAISLCINSSYHPMLLRHTAVCFRGAQYHGPIAFTSADVPNEAFDHFPTFDGVRYFRVKLNAVEGLGNMRDSRVRRCCCVAYYVEFGRNLGQLISMRHPDLCTQFRNGLVQYSMRYDKPAFRLQVLRIVRSHRSVLHRPRSSATLRDRILCVHIW